jgi:hypothetical protein
MLLASTTGVRLVELFFAVAWTVGLVLVWKTTRRNFLVGLYLGSTLTFAADWTFAGPALWNMKFAPHTLLIGTWGGRGEALWAPLSYGAFFGIFGWLWLRFVEPRLQPKLGPWRYALIFPAIYAGNLLVEGTLIQLTHANTYGLGSEWLLFNIPWLHFFTTGIMAAGLVWAAVQSTHLLELAGWHELEPHDKPQDVSFTRRSRVAIFSLGLAVPHVAFAAAITAGLYLYRALGVHG